MYAYRDNLKTPLSKCKNLQKDAIRNTPPSARQKQPKRKKEIIENAAVKT